MTMFRTYVLYCDGKGGEPDEPCASMLELADKSNLRAWMKREGWREEIEGKSAQHYCPRCQKLERRLG